MLSKGVASLSIFTYVYGTKKVERCYQKVIPFLQPIIDGVCDYYS
jgi:hypothetical protein